MNTRSSWRRFLPAILISLLVHALVLSLLPATSPPRMQPAPLLATLVALPPPVVVRETTLPPASRSHGTTRPARPARTTPTARATPYVDADRMMALAPFVPAPQQPPSEPVVEAVMEPDSAIVTEMPVDQAGVTNREPVGLLDKPVIEPAIEPAIAPVVPEADAAIASLDHAATDSAAPTPAVVPPIDLPPAASLHYTVTASDARTTPPTETFGSGTVVWQHESGRYSIALQASIDLLFISVSVLASNSSGTLETFGLAPDRYTEAPRRRPLLATNFNRDPAGPLANTISFSASAKSHPLMPAAQDRLSVIFQLAAMLRANPELRSAGRFVEVFVAGVRDAESWRFVVKGSERIEVGDTTMDTLRVQRLPRTDSYERAIEIWYALEHGGIPVRIRYTEANGSRVDLDLKGRN